MVEVAQKNSDARLEDRFQIEQAIRCWARAVDRRDWDLLSEVFHPDAIDNHGMYNGDIEGLIAWLKDRHRAISMSMHVLGNIYIEFANSDVAVSESYVVAYQRYNTVPGEDQTHIFSALGKHVDITQLPIDVVMPARYVDEFENRNGAWRIAQRTTVFEGRYILNSDQTPLDPTWTIGQRDNTDALYTARRRVGLITDR